MLCDVHEPGPIGGCIVESDFILTMIPPRIVRIVLKCNIHETIPPQPDMIMCHIFRTLRVGERATYVQVFVVLFLTKVGYIFRTLPSVLYLATYRYAISEDPDFITENHDEAYGENTMHSTSVRLDKAKAMLYVKLICTGSMMDGWARRAKWL